MSICGRPYVLADPKGCFESSIWGYGSADPLLPDPLIGVLNFRFDGKGRLTPRPSRDVLKF